MLVFNDSNKCSETKLEKKFAGETKLTNPQSLVH